MEEAGVYLIFAVTAGLALIVAVLNRLVYKKCKRRFGVDDEKSSDIGMTDGEMLRSLLTKMDALTGEAGGAPAAGAAYPPMAAPGGATTTTTRLTAVEARLDEISAKLAIPEVEAKRR